MYVHIIRLNEYHIFRNSSTENPSTRTVFVSPNHQCRFHDFREFRSTYRTGVHWPTSIFPRRYIEPATVIETNFR